MKASYPDKTPVRFLDVVTHSLRRTAVPGDPALDDENRSMPAPPLDLTVPDHLHKHVLCEPGNEAPASGCARTLAIYVDARHKASSAFLTWCNRLEKSGVSLSIKPVPVAELEQLRRVRGSAATEKRGQNKLSEAFMLFQLADAAEANDVHILQHRWDTEVQLRINGDLFTADRFSMHADDGTQFVRAIFNGLATNKPPTFDPKDFQNAQIDADALPETGIANVRIIRGPADPIDHGGGFLIARLQRRPGAERKLSRSAAIKQLELRRPIRPVGEFAIEGLRPAQLERLRRLACKPSGLLFFIGPTGSGKTTTQSKVLRLSAQVYPDRRQITIEDPPEYTMPWSIQLAKGERTFLDLLTKTLRMDPDILMLGELREPDEALAALQAALTGHLVLTTIHVADPYRLFQRLEDMDPQRLSRRSICDHEQIIGVVGQRILPTLCKGCRQPLASAQPDTVPAHLVDALRTWGDLSNVYVKGDGCPACHGTSLSGQQVIAEILETDEALMNDLRSLPVAEAKRQHRARPGTDHSMLAYAVAHVLAGRVDPTDAQKKIDLLPNDGESLPEVDPLC